MPGEYDWGSLVPTSGTSRLEPEPIEGNSLTRYLRSLTNAIGKMGPETKQAGERIVGAGMQTTGKGIQTFEAPLAYWSKLLSGDQQAMTEAVAPEAGAISSQYDTARRAAYANMPRGGYRSTTLAELPFRKASEIGSLYQRLRPEAAKQMSGIAQILSALGVDIGRLGMTQQGLGGELLGTVLQGLLTGRGQDVQEHGQAMGFTSSLIDTLI